MSFSYSKEEMTEAGRNAARFAAGKLPLAVTWPTVPGKGIRISAKCPIGKCGYADMKPEGGGGLLESSSPPPVSLRGWPNPQNPQKWVFADMRICGRAPSKRLSPRLPPVFGAGCHAVMDMRNHPRNPPRHWCKAGSMARRPASKSRTRARATRPCVAFPEMEESSLLCWPLRGSRDRARAPAYA